MRTRIVLLPLLALVCGALSADVVILKEGGLKVAGRVSDKKDHWEVVTEQGSRTFLKDEVERVVTDPKEFLGDSDSLYEQAKADFQKLVAMTAPAEQQVLAKEAIGKIAKAREAYATTRDLFPEDKHAALDQKLMQIMQLTRLLRDRLGSEIAKGPATAPRAAPPPTEAPRIEQPAAAPGLMDAFAALVDTAQRGDPAKRKAARDLFRDKRGAVPGLYDLSTAAMLFLSKSEGEWRLAGKALAALQEYFAKPWFKEPLKMSPSAQLEAALYLSDKIAEVKKAEPAASTDAMALFGMGHLGGAPAGPDVEKAARGLGLTLQNGLPGTAEGHAVRDLDAFLAVGDNDLAARAFVNDYRSLDTPSLRFLWSLSLLNLAIEKRKGFERAISALASVKGDGSVSAHTAALTKSIQAVTPCSSCLGDGWLRCTNCHGQKVIYIICKVCNGTRIKGGGFFCNPCKFTGIAAKIVCNKCRDGYFDCSKCKLPDCKACGSAGRTTCKICNGLRIIKNQCGVCNGSGLSAGFAGGAGGADPFCKNCKGSGNEKIVQCTACVHGFNDCNSCEPLRKPPAADDIAQATPCAACEGRGLAFRGVALPCRPCLGLGRKLSPKADPAKTLTD